MTGDETALKDTQTENLDPALIAGMPAALAGALGEVQTEAWRPEDERESYFKIVDQRREWQRRPLLRAVYREGFKRIIGEMARDEQGSIGQSIELGCGGGFFKEVCPDITATDVMLTPWCDRVADAHNLPYQDGTVRNVVMFDVLHHLPKPARFFSELVRVLEPGGRAVMLEPYVSPLSSLIYMTCHREPATVLGDPLEEQHGLSDAPMDGNNGIPRAIFFSRRGLRRFGARWPELQLLKRRHTSLFVYPLSGGFSGPVLLPVHLGKLGLRFERVLERPLGRLMAYRCLIVLEKG